MSQITTVAVLQPGYLPWLGFFDQMLRSDVFVYYDDVQFDKHGWRNRNRIKTPGGPQWLTVPILHSGRQGQRILDVEIDGRAPWAKKHVTSIRQNYSKAPFLSDYLPQLEALLERSWQHLVELDMAVVELMCDWLDIRRKVVRSSELGIGGEQSQRLLNICLHFGAKRYLSGDSAKNYLDLALFKAHEIEIEWQHYQHPVYPQMHGEFVPHLSALDLIINAGPASQQIIRGGN